MINSELKIALLFATIHFFIGNLLGIKIVDSNFLFIIGLPYTFVAGMSAFAGWDYLSLIFELLSFALMTILFYPLGLFINRNKK